MGCCCWVSDPYGLLLEVNESVTGVEEAALELLIDGAHFLQVEMASGEASPFNLFSTVRMKPFHDPDDGRLISVGQTIAASIDHHTDLDWFSIELNEGETVRISTDSINVNTILVVDFPDSHADQVVSDDDSGGGLTGLNSEMVYRAPLSGEFFIAVWDATRGQRRRLLPVGGTGSCGLGNGLCAAHANNRPSDPDT